MLKALEGHLYTLIARLEDPVNIQRINDFTSPKLIPHLCQILTWSSECEDSFRILVINLGNNVSTSLCQHKIKRNLTSEQQYV